MNKTWGQTFLTHDTPEGSIIKSSGPSGPWELNRTLWEKERRRSFTVQQHTKQNADCSIETFLNVSKKIPTAFFQDLGFYLQYNNWIWQTKIRTGKHDTRKLRSETKAGRKRKLEKYKKANLSFFFHTIPYVVMWLLSTNVDCYR